MLPWTYGFHWNVGTVIFLGAFYTVLVVLATTLIAAAWRSRHALRGRKTEEIRWHSDFHDLAPRDRVCRHVLTGELQHRECPNAFDCRDCETHAGFSEKPPLEQPAESEVKISGMSFPLDRMYHRGHTWVRRERDGTVTVGLDELGRRLLGSAVSMELPPRGHRLSLNGTAWRARRRKTEVRIVSPVSGKVVSTGGPDQEWYLKVRPERMDLRHLLSGGEVRPWLATELHRLDLVLSATSAAPAAGAISLADIAASHPQADWDAVCGVMFLNP